jgi:hypothetical protein
MFYKATAFDQTLCSWDLSGVSTTEMFFGSNGSADSTCKPCNEDTDCPETMVCVHSSSTRRRAQARQMVRRRLFFEDDAAMTGVCTYTR